MAMGGGAIGGGLDESFQAFADFLRVVASPDEARGRFDFLVARTRDLNQAADRSAQAEAVARAAITEAKTATQASVDALADIAQRRAEDAAGNAVVLAAIAQQQEVLDARKTTLDARDQALDQRDLELSGARRAHDANVARLAEDRKTLNAAQIEAQQATTAANAMKAEYDTAKKAALEALSRR